MVPQSLLSIKNKTNDTINAGAKAAANILKVENAGFLKANDLNDRSHRKST